MILYVIASIIHTFLYYKPPYGSQHFLDSAPSGHRMVLVAPAWRKTIPNVWHLLTWHLYNILYGYNDRYLKFKLTLKQE